MVSNIIGSKSVIIEQVKLTNNNSYILIKIYLNQIKRMCTLAASSHVSKWLVKLCWSIFLVS